MSTKRISSEQRARQWFGDRNLRPGLSKRCGHITDADVQSLASLIEKIRREREPWGVWWVDRLRPSTMGDWYRLTGNGDPPLEVCEACARTVADALNRAAERTYGEDTKGTYEARRMTSGATRNDGAIDDAVERT